MSRIGWCLSLLFLTVAAPAQAWSTQGHMATGLIAYDLLTQRDLAAIEAVEALMQNHPDRARFDSVLAGVDGTDRQRRLFELIGRWPDDIRHTRYDHKHWHHQLRVVAGWRLFGGVRLGRADHAFKRSLALLRDAKADPAQRAIALCWLFHVIGDMHQPLHAGHRMDARFPLTDRAGTIGWVRRAPDASAETLHHFWDSAAGFPGDDWAGADRIAAIARTGPPPEQASVGDPLLVYRDWVRESEQLAILAYRGAGFDESRRSATAPTLSPNYVANARMVAEERLGQAGARLAGVLANLFPPQPQQSSSATAEN